VPSIGRDAGFLIAAGAILLVAAGLRFHRLTWQGPWADELWTLLIADPERGVAGFWQRVVDDAHPPLYYLLMRGWSALFGQSDFAARLPSAICGILTVAAGGLPGLPRAGRLTLMALLALSPGAIEYAQEARAYALLLLLSMLVTAICVAIVSEPDADRASGPLVLLAVTGIIASYTHYFGFLLAVAAAIVALAVRRDRRTGLVLAVIVASFVPWAIYHAYHLSVSARQLAAWMGDFPLAATGSWFLRLWLGGSASLFVVGMFVGAVWAATRFSGSVRNNRVALVGGALALLTVAPAVIISWWLPVLSARNLVVVMPPLYLAIAALAGETTRLSRTAAAAGVAVLLALMVPGLTWYYSVPTKEEWRASADFVLAQSGCSKGPIYVYGDKAIYAYLVGKARPELQLVEVPWGKAAAAELTPAGDCPVVLWAGKISPEDFAQALSQLPPRKPACRQVTAFHWAFVVRRDPDDPACREIP
jgi:4-amino-4-deoxy-L-arabinose transferase-like glycosyltransferase